MHKELQAPECVSCKYTADCSETLLLLPALLITIFRSHWLCVLHWMVHTSVGQMFPVTFWWAVCLY